MDGTITTQPEFSFWFKDVGWGCRKNYGTDPDIEVDIMLPKDYVEGKDPQLDVANVLPVRNKENPPAETQFWQRSQVKHYPGKGF